MLGTMAISLALPIGVAIAVWLVEYGRPKALARMTEMTIEAIAGIPSIVLALFGTVIFTSPRSASSAAPTKASSSAAPSSPPPRCWPWRRCR